MARMSARRSWRRLPGPVLAALAVITALTAAPVAAAASTGTSPATAAALTRAFEAGRHVPGSAIGGIRPGTLHAGTAGGTEWAIASFTPSASAGKQVAAGFQDGGGTGVFSVGGGGWRLVKTGPYGCGEGLPATLKKAWGSRTQRAAPPRSRRSAPPPSARCPRSPPRPAPRPAPRRRPRRPPGLRRGPRRNLALTRRSRASRSVRSGPATPRYRPASPRTATRTAR